MASITGNPSLWKGVWNASTLPAGVYTIDVQATTGSGIRTDTVTTYVESQVLPVVGVSDMVVGKYVTSGSGKNKTTTFTPTSIFKRGETVVIRSVVKNSSSVSVANATVQLQMSGPVSTGLTSVSDSNGLAEAKWTTSSPNKRGQGGTPLGSYTAVVTNVTAPSYQWDGKGQTVAFTIQ